MSKKPSKQTRAAVRDDEIRYVIFRIGHHEFGLDVREVRDVFKPVRITRIPLAPSDVYGVLNLRGRIVTVIDMYEQLGISKSERDDSDITKLMNIVVEYKGEAYALLVDEIGEVLVLNSSTFESTPTTMNENWKNIAKGIQKLDRGLLIILDVEKALTFVDSVGIEGALHDMLIAN